MIHVIEEEKINKKIKNKKIIKINKNKNKIKNKKGGARVQAERVFRECSEGICG